MYEMGIGVVSGVPICEPRNKAILVEFFPRALPNSWYNFSASNIERIISCSPTEILNVLVIEICISEKS